MSLELSDESWCVNCQKKPVVVTNIFSNISIRQETLTCKDCGTTLGIKKWTKPN